MSILSKINLAGISQRNRVLTWVLLILLTVLLLLFPVHLTNEYHSIQAPYLFDNLPLFGALFYLWMLLILLLLFSKRDEGNKLTWENLALACIFGVVFLGFWAIITPYGSYADGIYNMGNVRWLGEEGTIPVGHANLHYFDFPGMHLLVSAVSQTCGLGVFKSAMLFLIFNAMLFSALLYIFLAKSLKSSRLAFLGVLLVMLGSVVLVEKIHVFAPAALGFTFLASLLVVMCRSEGKLFGTTASDRLLMLILFIAMTISYLPTSFLVILILLGIYVVQRIGRDREAVVRPATIILLLVIVFAWEIYWTYYRFNNFAVFLPELWNDLSEGEFLTSLLILGSANMGGALPLWASVSRFLWWALLGFSTILGLRNLLRIKNLNLAEKIITGGLLGVILLTIIATLGTERGTQFMRFLLYAPIFCAPILLIFIYKSGTWRRRGLALLVIIIFVPALPTFLSSVNTVSTDAIYPYECAAGEFMESNSHEKGESHIIYSTSGVSASWSKYYIADTSLKGVSKGAYYSEDELWQKLDALLQNYQNPRYRPWEQKVFVLDEKSYVPFQHSLGIPPDQPEWEKLRESLSSGNMIYNNGHVKMYIP